MDGGGCEVTMSTPGEAGVLLYYKYLNLGKDGREAVKAWYENVCRSEGLRGRVRVALDGVNCTLGGDITSLRRHIAEVRSHEWILGTDIDFKLSVSQGPRNWQAAMESGFAALSVKAVKEVVSLGARGASLSPEDCGRHITPHEFHDILKSEVGWLANLRSPPEGYLDGSMSYPLANGGALVDEAHADLASSCLAGTESSEEGDGVEGSSTGTSAEVVEAVTSRKETVLLDVRNVYETSIGHFSADGIERLDPGTRQFSDLPAWVDGNVHRLRGKRVLMYCTGGVRCEKASALVRKACEAGSSSGTEVLQLAGGIERYLQAFPGPGPACGGARNGNREPEGGSCGEPSDLKEGCVTEENEHRGRLTCATGTKDMAETGGYAMDQRDEESFFRGKNFVFDERISVPELPTGGEVVGRCILCCVPWDDYGNRARCSKCRMLVLVCDFCMDRQSFATGGPSLTELGAKGPSAGICMNGNIEEAPTPRKQETTEVMPVGGDAELGVLGSPKPRSRHCTERELFGDSELSTSSSMLVGSPGAISVKTRIASSLPTSGEATASAVECSRGRKTLIESVPALPPDDVVWEGIPRASSDVVASPLACTRMTHQTAEVPEGRIVITAKSVNSSTHNIVCGFCRQRRKS